MAARPQNWEAIKAMFEAALEQDEGSRPSFLQENCSDPSVRIEVERLLSEHEQAGDFLSTPALEDLRFSAASPMPPQRLSQGDLLAGRFRIVRFVAAGGMGEVYEAEDQELRERVAIKIIRPEILAQSNAVARFKREVNLARRVTDPNVCRIYDLFRHKSVEADGREELVFVSMEMLEGPTLAEQLKSGAMAIDEAWPLVQQMASALTAAHAAGIVHRDFKPGNVVLVAASGKKRAVVTDFGLALRSLTSDDAAAHSTGQTFFGTPAYMSPEQLEGQPATPASDIYAFGLVVYEMITGVRPFRGTTPISASLKKLTEQPPPPGQFRSGLSRVWERVILRCLARNPAERFARMEDVVIALTAASIRPDRIAGVTNGVVSHTRTGSPVLSRHALPAGRSLLLFAFATLLTVAAVFSYRTWANHEKASVRSPKSQDRSAPGMPIVSASRAIRIAVLPFKAHPDVQEFRKLSATISDELVNELAQEARDDVRVLAESSVAQYNPAKTTPPQMAQLLGAQYLVQGSIDCYNRKPICGRNLLEIKVNIVDASDQIQGEQTYLPQGDFSKTQVQIAEWVARTIQVKLLPEAVTGVQIGGTTRPEAYERYLQGKYEWAHGFEPKAFSDFQEAIALDPKYALAHEAIARMHIFRGSNIQENRIELIAAKDEAKTAIALDERLAEAHVDLAWVLDNADFDWPAAEAEYRRALALNPSNLLAHKWYAMFLAAQRRGPEAVEQAQEAMSLDPASLPLKAAYGWILIDAGQTDAGIDYLEKTLQLEDNGVAWGYLGGGYSQKHEYQKAADAFQHAADASARQNLKTAYLAYRAGVAANLWMAGYPDRARPVVAQVRGLWEQGVWVPACNLSLMYFAMDDNDDGFRFLRHGLQERSCTIREINNEPTLLKLWDDPRFRDIRTEFHLPDNPPTRTN